MRLKTEQIERLSQVIFQILKEKKLIIVKAGDKAVLNRIELAITQDIEAEVQLDEAVEALMDQYKSQIKAGNLNERDLFMKMKKEMAKKKNIVL